MTKLFKETGKFIFACVFIGIVVYIWNPDNEYRDIPPANALQNICDGADEAFDASHAFVKERLIHPRSADFPRHPVKADYKGNCRTFILSTVEYKNSEGKTTEGSYMVEMVFNKADETWSAHNLIVQ